MCRAITARSPLNNAGWLLARFAEAAALGSEPERLAAIDRIVRWTDSGNGVEAFDIFALNRSQQFFGCQRRQDGEGELWANVLNMHQQIE